MRTTFNAVDNEDNSLAHYNRPGTKWYQHKFGKWQKQAQYAGGKDDPNAKTPSESASAPTPAPPKPKTHEELLKSTDPKEIYARRDELTTNELREMVDRVRFAQSLKDTINSEAFKEAQAVADRQRRGKEAFEKGLKKFSDAALDVAATAAKQGMTYGVRKLAEQSLGKDTAKQIFDPQGYKDDQQKAKAKKQAEFIQNNLDDIVANPQKYSMESLNAANTRISTIRALSQQASIFSQDTFQDMAEHPEKYSAADLARASQQAEQLNKIINRKTIGNTR